eukprot:TRINITY_DN14785_c0_g1_i1.p1 TRINITY_DN14785_c0_g1~~TRINITY_DN14785_c0_g1_i1.p1  ORF type:complete len:594 (+),score=69.88 TRINITY_DN14785_c0_g1_i1:72-1784(+)
MGGVVRWFAALASLSAVSSSDWLAKTETRLRLSESRSLQSSSKTCDVAALNMFPPPSLAAYRKCFTDKLKANNTHDWAVPGAEVAADTECWCKNNISALMEQESCCAEAVYPMCSVDCNPDCGGALAKECIDSCPSMCFEAAEYVVDKDLCSKCNWVKCWPVVRCLTAHAQARVANGSLDKTCAEDEFWPADKRPQQLDSYWDCWRNAPKHTSHYNALASVVHCACRAQIPAFVNQTHCCNSVLYGGGFCDVECVDEVTCGSQVAQTCIHGCQVKCRANSATPSSDCISECLHGDSHCRKFSSCRPPPAYGYVCDDGRWPEAASGCCYEMSGRFGCPKLCQIQKVWRHDRKRGLPWWTRWNEATDMVVSCTCDGCPATMAERRHKLEVTVYDSLWTSGQLTLVDVARRAGLQLGPNRRMQELMQERNDAILDYLKQVERQGGNDDAAVDSVANLHAQYAVLIEQAAYQYGDDYEGKAGKRGAPVSVMVLILACTVLILLSICGATILLIRRKKRTAIQFAQNFDPSTNTTVVFGSPVLENSTGSADIHMGAPVTVSAKGGLKKEAFKSTE